MSREPTFRLIPGRILNRMATGAQIRPTLEGQLGNLEWRVIELSQAVQDLRAGQRQILLSILGLGGVMLGGLGGVIAALVALTLRGG